MIRATNNNHFPVCPEGLYQAVIADVVDLGWNEVFYKGQSKGLLPECKIVFQPSELRPDGSYYLLFTPRGTVSTYSKAGFRRLLDAVFGKKAVEAALANDGIDEESLVGANVRVQVEHVERDGHIYANVTAILPWNAAKDGEPMVVTDYVRRCEREDWVEPEYSAFGPGPKPARTAADNHAQSTPAPNAEDEADEEDFFADD